MMDIPNQKKKAIEQIKDTEETIQRLNAGKFTFGGMLKSDKEKKRVDHFEGAVDRGIKGWCGQLRRDSPHSDYLPVDGGDPFLLKAGKGEIHQADGPYVQVGSA